MAHGEARMRRILHRHVADLLVVVGQVDVPDIAPVEAEDHPPVGGHPHHLVTGAITLQRMES